MVQEKGNISIETENIFPIIKKWLYSEKDIFVRELISNSSDAISKLERLSSLGEVQIEENKEFQIKVSVDKKEKTIKIIDNGIGMTFDEVKNYINRIAFSGAKDFVEKYKDKADEAQIIGHFGLGFYSAFMVSKRVQIDTLSYIKGEKAVKWTSDGNSSYEMDESEREQVGTTVTLYIDDDSKEFLDGFKMRNIIEKYFSFLKYPIYFEDKSVKDEKTKETEKEPLNDNSPLWLKNPKECTDDEYKQFYKKVFNDFNDPLFWVHLNIDYPFKLKGILYFPKLKHEFDTIQGEIKLYYNQVFVADNIKEIIPEFLMLLKGMLDCPDLPLNVSRNFLQNDGYVNRLSVHIVKKVADKLISLFKKERENYNKYWDDINPFVKYGCLREEKFYEKMKDYIIYKTTEGNYITLKDYAQKNENTVYYVTDEKLQSQYIKLFKEQGLEAVLLNTMIDNHFISFIEMKEKDIKFKRIDSDISDVMKLEDEKLGEEESDKIKKVFEENLNIEGLKISVEPLKSKYLPAMILLSEHSRRMQEMSKMFGGMDAKNMFPEDKTFVINSNNKLVKSVAKMRGSEEKKEDVKIICEQIYDMAILSQSQLDSSAMSKFIERTSAILERIT